MKKNSTMVYHSIYLEKKRLEIRMLKSVGHNFYTLFLSLFDQLVLGNCVLLVNLRRMRLEKCWFCSSTVYPGHGIQFVRNDAKIFRFCRSKCHKNFKMKRNPRKVKWTKAYRRLHGKDMTQDSTFEFERKRNRPERYDRNLAENTLKAIKKIDKIRSDRASDHIKNRLKTSKVQRQKEARKQLELGIHLVKAPLALAQDSSLCLPKIKVNVSQAQTEENQPMED
ncbi:hypothetical protein ES332_D01G112000v1 [Gossypium tomentosum]|uniref:TRASH domain-containing protein n=1 Tax=Gossypium tomentosum TaxID=34277 RepID=A0A5D2M7Q4_GOSTO|nr:hypothetical protein ES332_D01G112000v1 [Gossypium tomentosum]